MPLLVTGAQQVGNNVSRDSLSGDVIELAFAQRAREVEPCYSSFQVHAAPLYICVSTESRYHQAMYILDVIPLIALPTHQSSVVNYFYDTPLPRGTVVETTFNNRKIKGVVVGSDPLAKRKLAFKKEVGFTLKKISRVVKIKLPITDNQLKLAEYISHYYYAPLGLSLKTVLSPLNSKKLHATRYTLHDPTLHLFPEHIQAHYFLKQNPDATTGTRSTLFMPFTNLKKIIIHDESNEFYKSDMTPKYHGVDVAHEVARLYGANIEIVDSPIPRLETYAAQGAVSLQLKTYSCQLVDMIREIRDANYSIFSRDLKEALYQAQEKKQHVILYVPRRGHANSLRCQTCGESVRCPNCSVALILYELHVTRYTLHDLRCHHCNFSQPRPKQCPACKSYALKPHGVGIDKVESELKKLFAYQNLTIPPIFKLDSDESGNDDRKEVELVSRFLGAKPAILLATQIVFSHRSVLKNIPLIGIISGDTLIHIPDFRAEESLFRQCMTLATMTDDLIIQTYNPENPAFKAIANNATDAFLKQELVNREQFSYPPFASLIKLTYRHRDPRMAQREARIVFDKLVQALRGLKLPADALRLMGPSPAFISREKGVSAFNIILKIDVTRYTLHDLQVRNQLLDYVPPGWSIDVDPKSIL